MVTVHASNILKLRSVIYSEQYKFSMMGTQASPSTGDCGCIGSHAAAIWPDVRSSEGSEPYTWDEAKLAVKLCVTLDQLDQICFPNWLTDRTRWDACEMLLNLAINGDVKWQ